MSIVVFVEAPVGMMELLSVVNRTLMRGFVDI